MSSSSSTSQQYLLYLIGSLLLIHSGYSSFEYHKISTHYHHINNATTNHLPPLDIIIESIIGIFLLVIGSIVSITNQPFYSVNNEVVTSDSKYLKYIEMKDAVQLSEKVGITDYEEYNSRLPFIDIKQKRSEYKEWLEKE